MLPCSSVSARPRPTAGRSASPLSSGLTWPTSRTASAAADSPTLRARLSPAFSRRSMTATPSSRRPRRPLPRRRLPFLRRRPGRPSRRSPNQRQSRTNPMQAPRWLPPLWLPLRPLQPREQAGAPRRSCLRRRSSPRPRPRLACPPRKHTSTPTTTRRSIACSRSTMSIRWRMMRRCASSSRFRASVRRVRPCRCLRSIVCSS